MVTATKTKYVVPGKVNSKSREIPNIVKNHPKNENSTRNQMETYHWCEGHVENTPRWVIHKRKECRGLKKKHKEDEDRKNKSDNESQQQKLR